MAKKKSYPANLLEYVKFNETYGFHVDYDNLMDDQFQGLEYILENIMSERNKLLIDLRYKKCMTYKEITAGCNLTDNRTQQLFREIHRRLSNLAGWAAYVPNGFVGHTEYLENLLTHAESLYCGERGITNSNHIYYRELEQLGLTTYACHCFKRVGVQTVRDLTIYMAFARRTRGVGEKTLRMAYDALKAEKLIPADYKPKERRNGSDLENTVSAFVELVRYTV